MSFLSPPAPALSPWFNLRHWRKYVTVNTKAVFWICPRMETPQPQCQCLVTLTVKKVIPGVQTGPSRVSVCSYHLWFCHWTPLKRAWLCPLWWTLPSGIFIHWWDPPKSSLQAEQSQLSHPLLIWEVLQSLNRLCGLHETLSRMSVSLVLRNPELDTVFQVWPH